MNTILLLITTVSIVMITYSVYQLFIEDYFKKYSKKKRQSKELIYEQDNGVEFVRINIKRSYVDYDSIDKYFEITNDYIQTAKESIRIANYLPSNNVIIGLYKDKSEFSNDNAAYLKKKYEEYYKNLEGVIKANRDIEYTRIAQISGFYRNHQYPDLKDLVERAIDFMTPNQIEHIFKMYSKCGYGRGRFKFYIRKTPASLYNYMIIDDEFVLSEYPNYNENGVSFPDELYINRKTSLSSQFEKRISHFSMLKKTSSLIDFDCMEYAYEEFHRLHRIDDYYGDYKNINELMRQIRLKKR